MWSLYAPYIGSIFFQLQVQPMGMENNLNGITDEKPPKLNYANMSGFFLNRQILMPRIISDLQWSSM